MNPDQVRLTMICRAKGCPYEAATMMLQGGSGLRYIEQSTVDSIVNNPAVDKVTLILMQAYFDLTREIVGVLPGITNMQGVMHAGMFVPPIQYVFPPEKEHYLLQVF